MKYSPLLQQTADALQKRLERYTSVPVKDYGWENHVWTGPYFRWAHLEKFFTSKVSVLHCVVMPLAHSGSTIYGFDVIEMNGKLTGMFLDVTPVADNVYVVQVPQVGTPRPVPEWGDFFSDDFCCCVPEPDDLIAGIQTLRNYMDLLPYTLESGKDYTPQQHAYIEGQRRNPQTYRMLKSFVGEDTANEFIDTVLWPLHK